MLLKLIVGLGNPGQKYHLTRHNTGFLFIDQLLAQAKIQKQQPKFNAEVFKVSLNKKDLWILKPMTYMNRSGSSVSALMKYYQIDCHEILVVHDELDLPAGVIRLKSGGGFGGHNGLKDIGQCLASNDFLRLRIGIGRPTQGDVINYVLKQSGKDEAQRIEQRIVAVLAEFSLLMTGDYQKFMNKIN